MDAQKLKALEDKHRRLKKLLAESMLDVAALKVLLEKTDRDREPRRAAVLRLTAERGFSPRRAGELTRASLRCPAPSTPSRGSVRRCARI